MATPARACPQCSGDVREGWLVCPHCAATLVALSQAPTVAMSESRTPSHSSSEEGRFPAGSTLSDRYRILGLLGQGGMGEVYRAHDQILNQPVALKFLAQMSESALTRFRNEVRIARQVSHPNVCRVYDIGSIDGMHFLSMEYVDGEDLRSLLRRIGRLPGDKALEIARRLCAGLAAAHDKGVLHRDLKPANIMLDGRGQVLITDFGLAALAGQIEDGHFREGTPAYQAPEQRDGKEVSVRSDIYALGLVLHEMFTGKRPGDTSTTPSLLVKDLDPAVERVILRCLEPDPRNRPATALAVAAALPGGDPLAAALAAGETPTPGMVAAAGDTEGIPVSTAVLCLLGILVGLAVAVTLGARLSLFRKTPFPNSPEILAQKSRELIQTAGYADPPADSAFGFETNADYLADVGKNKAVAAYRSRLATGEPPVVQFWYRQGPEALRRSPPDNGIVTSEDPPPIHSGMVALKLDPRSRLLAFEAIPPQVEEASATATPYNWTPLFAAAGLDMARFTPAEPKWVSLAPSDARLAWTGAYPSAPEIPLRVEAASWHGKPVFFRLIAPWSKPERMRPESSTQVADLIVLVPTLLAGFLAWRNFRNKRGDIRGATRVAGVVLAVAWLNDVLRAHHVLSDEVGILAFSLLFAIVPAFFVWMFYLALEPYVRRRWPQSLISWSRLLSGGFRDPMVGGHLLYAVGLGTILAMLELAIGISQENGGAPGMPFDTLPALLGGRHLLAALANEFVGLTLEAMAFTFIIMLFRVLLRREWLAGLAFAALLTSGGFTPSNVVPSIFGALTDLLFAVILLRFGGLLPTIVCGFVGFSLILPITTDLSAWYSSITITVVALILALTAYAFHTAIAGRPLLKPSFLDTD